MAPLALLLSIFLIFWNFCICKGEARAEGRVGGASRIAPFYFFNFLEFLDEKYQKLEILFLVSVILEASFRI